MVGFKVINLRRRMATLKGQIPGVPGSIQTLEGIEMVLDYVPKTKTGITAEEEKQVVDFINARIQQMKESNNPFITLYNDENPTPDQQGAPDKNSESTGSDKNPTQDEASVWKAKYEEEQSKRRGLQLKVNEYKKKLIAAGLIKDESTTTGTEGKDGAESATSTRTSKRKGNAGA